VDVWGKLLGHDHLGHHLIFNDRDGVKLKNQKSHREICGFLNDLIGPD